MLWLYLAETWPNYQIPTDPDQRAVRIQVWSDQLGDLDPQQVRAAIASLGNREFPPAPGVIREKAVELAQQAEGERQAPDPDEAWRVVFENACGRLYKTNTHDCAIFDHLAVQQAVRAVGWDEIRYSEEPHFVRAAFLKVYATSAERYKRESLLPPPAVLAFVADHGAIKRADDVLGIGPSS